MSNAVLSRIASALQEEGSIMVGTHLGEMAKNIRARLYEGGYIIVPAVATDNMCGYAKHRHPELNNEQARGIYHCMAEQALRDINS